ncbi:lysine transporter LysE [Arenicella chitinivorans]|uniref:Lysine transporter LysE n=1 Tax=Arenicella chitinivorans TaxID=1329800 RepID=A0A918VL51_9GAMM|nr:LysE family translocator [Arenicella chitinivorans]GHA10422.1 lysine transporter LysE [Arenicella chitinivorans]
MELTSVMGFVVMATLLVISPGPNGLLVTKTFYAAGRPMAIANIVGFIGAFYVHGTLAVFGISMLIVQSAQAYQIFKFCGAAYLIWLGLRSLIDAWRSDSTIAPVRTVGRAQSYSIRTGVTEGFLTNVLNPKVSIFYLAAFPQFLPLEGSSTVAYMLVTTHMLINVVWFSLMVMLLSQIDVGATGKRLRRVLKSITGTFFIGFGIKLLLLKPMDSD